ncbi:uncharacterized protein [Solanum lycopersicum]|nr:uncharacterized protein LOC101259953 [Solanum lycopersicum]
MSQLSLLQLLQYLFLNFISINTFPFFNKTHQIKTSTLKHQSTNFFLSLFQNIIRKKKMVCFCFLVDQTKQVCKSKPVAGTCSRCGGGASVADMKTATRFCYVPFYWKNWRAIICTFCGAILRSYR